MFYKLQRFIGSHVESYFKEFLELEKLSSPELQTIQRERLSRLLQHAKKNIAFYRERIPPKKSLELTDFPIIQKEDIKQYYRDFMQQDVLLEYGTGRRGRMYSWIEVKTGGSTGMPTTVIHDKEFRDRGRASRLYSQYLCGFPFGVPYFRLWGSMKEINSMRDSIPNRTMSMLSGEVVLNAFRLGDEEIKKYIGIINKMNIDHMMAYVDAAYQMAKYSQKTGYSIKPLKSIMACAGTVTEEIRKTLTDVYKARVHNKYGSRDCADIACECEHGKLHIFSNNVFIEVVDSEGKPLPAGKSGRILVTILSNYSFPLIRYEIGDVGTLTDETCRCGRPFPLLKTLEGRTVEFLQSTDGGHVSPVYIRHLIGVIHNPGTIKRFQLIQHSLADYELKLELEQNTSLQSNSNVLAEITKDLKAVFGTMAVIRIVEVPEIKPTASGKHIYTLNKIKASNENTVRT